MLRTIRLYGPLKDLANTDTLELDVDTPLMLMLGLRSQVPGFRQFCSDHDIALLLADADGSNQTPLVADEFNFQFGLATHIHIVPKVEGAGGEIIVAIAAYLGTSTAVATVVYIAANIAISLAIGAVIQALAPSPDTSGGAGRADDKPSFMYNGAVNVIEQGYPIPLVYGIHMTGSIVVSAGVEVEEIPYVPVQDASPANGGGTAQPAFPPVQEYQGGY